MTSVTEETTESADAPPTTSPWAFSADAAEFVPAPAVQSIRPSDVEIDVVASLPIAHQRQLRVYSVDPMTGEQYPYYVGRLKSFSNSAGFGFIACHQSMEQYGTDVFIHKNFITKPWNVGRPVEFAVQVNQRGQPQAVDVRWLPMTRNVPMQGGAKGGYTAQTPGPNAAGGMANGSMRRPAVDQPRRIGQVKSFSSHTGYGFIDCAMTREVYNRDVYLDASQMASKKPEDINGRIIEFDVQVNNRGQPQATQINNDPIPLTVESAKQPRGDVLLKKLGELLALLHSQDYNQAVITAINNSGSATPSAVSPSAADVDYVSYVLQRITEKAKEIEPAIKKLKDFTKLLLILIIAKMLRKNQTLSRTPMLLQCLEVAAGSIEDPNSPDLQDHFAGTSEKCLEFLQRYRNEDFSTPENREIVLRAEQKLLEAKSARSVASPPSEEAAS
eukprot:TRINITY_DN70944_c0_g1_i1.p1 TRINITY_DN70944_c0_g1~~TRINITY_DN70944_c0_g1_i1.p1  ORF type:complete len:444 (+),score=87.13 TRINITY_DN70944_c0_g1_i1:52-1383(+)